LQTLSGVFGVIHALQDVRVLDWASFVPDWWGDGLDVTKIHHHRFAGLCVFRRHRPILGGRIALINLLPFSSGELADAGRLPASFNTLLLTGGFRSW